MRPERPRSGEKPTDRVVSWLAHLIRSSGVIGAAWAEDALPRCDLSSRLPNISVGRWRLAELGEFGAHRPARHGPVGWNQRAMPANNSASGCEAAKAMRTRVAVSMTLAATLSAAAAGW